MRYLLGCLALLLLPQNVVGLTYYTFNHTGSALPAATTVYASIAGATTNSSTEAEVQCLIPGSVTISDFTVWVDTEPVSAETWQIDLNKNGTSQFNCTITSASSGTCSGSGSASFSAGDLASMVFAPSGSPTATKARWTVSVTTADDMTSFLCGSTIGNMLNSTGALYALNGQDASPGTAAFDSEFVISTPGTIDALYVDLTVAPGAGKTRTFTVNANGSGSSVTCQIAGTATTCNDTSHSASLSAGHDIALAEAITGFGTPASSVGRWAVRFIADRAGDIMIGDSIVDNVSAAANRYWHISGLDGTYQASEDTTTQQSNEPIMTCYRVYFEGNLTPGGLGGTYVLTVRQNGADTDLACTMATAATTCNDDGTVLVTSGDNKLGKECDPVGPGNTPNYHGTLTCEVPTRRRW